ncbi:MAG: SDR family NAD(P)-dependent oxidoreductase [Gammaproteobacteria bacterium]|nr:SDR family NAD(P)-dependent oxidoreductase [Gammaproteobacteria bacterium]
MQNQQTFLVTGAMGCLGSWVLRNLLDQGARVVAADLATEPSRARLLMTDAEIADINWVSMDVTDAKAVDDIVASNDVSHIVHLAGLQIPFCKANPSTGAAVNVVGTVNILEAARKNNVKGLCYASSLAAFGPEANYPERPIKDDAPLIPSSLYGVYKAANEGTAKVYWQDYQLGSVGLRPYIVYGVARDQGLTSDIAKAILATAANKPFHIRFDGPVALQHANDTAQIFIRSAQAEYQGAAACNLRGDVIEVATFLSLLDELFPENQVTLKTNAPLPYPSDLDDSGLRRILGDVPFTPLRTAIVADVQRFKTLIEAGKVDLEQLNK